jgi:hypothetical protein
MAPTTLSQVIFLPDAGITKHLEHDKMEQVRPTHVVPDFGLSRSKREGTRQQDA